MKCQYCGCLDSKVIDSRPTDDGNTIRRRRECLSCGRRFTTYEKVELSPLYVVKRDGRREAFDSQKIKSGILHACNGLSISMQQIDDIVHRIEQQAYATTEGEVTSGYAPIVIDLEKNSSQKLIDEIRAEPDYKEIFISGQDALLAADNRSILIVVDTNRPDQVECKPLLEAIPKVCVVDHHRRAADYINPVVVNLHEPYASSASELVTEILLYAVEKKDVLDVEAKALMAGICLDTKFFNVRTGERTFEAAAALRRMGADTTEVKMLLQNDFQDTMAKYQIIKSSRLYRQEIAIAALNTGTTRVLAAQAADELLNISGISASFVLYPDEDQVIISARSIGSANVQMILEPLGGGGNTATAGAQLKSTTVKDALDRLVESIDKFYEQ